MEKVLFRHGGTKLPPRWNRMFPTVEQNVPHGGTNKPSHLHRLTSLPEHPGLWRSICLSTKY